MILDEQGKPLNMIFDQYGKPNPPIQLIESDFLISFISIFNIDANCLCEFHTLLLNIGKESQRST
jgi:hypothetical protein